MSKDPAFLFYPADASEDTQFMNRLERGAYFDLVKSQRLFHGFTIEQLRKVLGKDFDSVFPALQLVLKCDEQGYFILWVRESLEKRKAFSDKQKERITTYWNNRGNTVVIPLENENENENKNKNKVKKVSKSIPENLQVVELFFTGQGSTIEEASNFYDYFSSNGWKVGGRAPMKDWQAAARRWIKNSFSGQSPGHGKMQISKNGPIQKLLENQYIIENYGKEID